MSHVFLRYLVSAKQNLCLSVGMQRIQTSCKILAVWAISATTDIIKKRFKKINVIFPVVAKNNEKGQYVICSRCYSSVVVTLTRRESRQPEHFKPTAHNDYHKNDFLKFQPIKTTFQFRNSFNVTRPFLGFFFFFCGHF